MDIATLKSRMRLPVIAAPMFLVSGPELTVACCRNGVIGSFPAANARSTEELAGWLEQIDRALGRTNANGGPYPPYAVNLVVRYASDPRFSADLALIEKVAPEVVITSVGPPGNIVERVHAYGGLVFHDVASVRHARKAAEAGVDGLILLTAGAGGHTGHASPFAFVGEIRRFYDGAILLAGSISDGRSVRAAEILGADFAYMGTRFAATVESRATEDYKALLVSHKMADVVTTDRISGLPANFLRESIARVGLEPDKLPKLLAPRQPGLLGDLKAWRDIWSGGHGVGLIEDVPTVEELIDRLERDYFAARRNRK